MTVRKYAVLLNNIVQTQALWDGTVTWNPVGYSNGTVTKADISTSGYVKMGVPFHDRQGFAYNWNFVIDGNSLALGESGNPTIKATVNGILDSSVSPAPLSYDLINMARNGWATPDLTTKAANDIDLLYETPIGVRNICIFWEGTNDLNNGKTDVQAYNNIKAYCQARKAAGWKVIVGTLLPRTGSANAQHETYRLSVNAMIRAAKVAEETWLDQVADVGGDATIGATGAASNTTYYFDGIHLTTAGHTIAKTYFSTAINSL